MKIASLLDDTQPDLDDDDKRSIANVIGRMRRRMRQGSYLALKDGIDDLEELGLHDDRIAKELATVKDDIMTWLDKSLGHAYTDRLVNQILMLIDMGLEWPEIAGSLDTHKDAVVKSMLQRLSQDSADPMVLLHLRGYIERFGKMGIRWPELRIIWKSLAYALKDRDLDEDDNGHKQSKAEYANDNFKHLMDMCKQGKFTDAMTMISHMYIVRNEMDFSAIDATGLDVYKDQLIRELLFNLKDAPNNRWHIALIEDSVLALRALGRRWPELNVIEKSVKTVLKGRVNETVDKDKPSWYMDIADALTQGNIYKALNIIRMHELDIEEYPMLEPLLDSFKWVFIRHLDRSLKDEFDGFDETVRILKQIKQTGIKWSEIDTFWDDHKPEVMKQLFRQITSNDEHAGYYTWQEINTLKVEGVRWPELGIVLKSALAVMDEKDQKQIGESRRIDEMFISDLKKTDASGLREIISCLSRGDYEAAMTWMSEMGMGPMNIPVSVTRKSRDIIEQHRNGIIKTMLMVIKSPVEFGFNDDLDVLMVIRAAERLRLDWPEIKVMMRSMDAAIKQVDEDDDWEDRRREMRYDADVRDDAAAFADKLTNLRNFKQFFEFVDDMANSDLSDKEIDGLFDNNLSYLVDWFADSELDEEPGYVMAFVELLDDHGIEKNHQWVSEVVAALEGDKERILRFLLSMMRYSNLYSSRSAIERYVKLLHKLGLTWTELDIIGKSLAADAKRIGAPNG